MSAEHARRAVSADLSQLKSRLRTLYVQWCVGGPTLEASSAIAAMAQEESGHTRILTRLAAGTASAVSAAELVPSGDIASWPELVGTVGPLEITLAALLADLKGVQEPEFSRHLVKMALEERHHAQFFTGWFVELGADASAAGTTFTRAREASEQRIAAWLERAAPVLAEAGASSMAAVAGGTSGAMGWDGPGDAACVHCGGLDSVRVSAFGASLMTELRKCRSCGSPFESVRWKPVAS
jgi:hypothetical protein